MDMDIIKKITGLIGLGLMFTFIIGLAHSISTGFAGFLGWPAVLGDCNLGTVDDCL